MRLGQILAALPDNELDRLAREHVHTQDHLSRPQLCNFLESAIRSYSFVNEFVTNRQPPTFAILTLLLEAPENGLPAIAFQEAVLNETKRIGDLVESGEILARDDGLRLYRRLLYEARRNDLDLNSSEAALLRVVRQETGIAQVEHFLLEHHPDLREFWEKDGAFLHEQNALRSAGLVFALDGNLLIADDVAPAIRQTLGVEMPRQSARRLFEHLAGRELSDALAAAGSRTAGSKEARLDRLLVEWIQPRDVLRTVGLPTLKEICRDSGAAITGNKDDLIERIVTHFAQGKDQEEEPPEPSRPMENRSLGEARFRALFGALTGQELSDILRRFGDLRQSGTKSVKISTLWEAHLAEETLLAELMNRDLEAILIRLGLRLGGSKSDRIGRIIEHFSLAPLQDADDGDTIADADEGPGTQRIVQPSAFDSEVSSRQVEFQIRSADLQNGLVPWLEELLDAAGKVRCYATEVSNPTQQLKNKLAQAVAARGGILVLILADEDAFLRARDALVERWGTNDEWMKSVACVALAHPQGDPAIRSIVEWSNSQWPDRVRRLLFPDATIVRARGSRSAVSVTQVDHASETSIWSALPCNACKEKLPRDARFCPACGAQVSA